MKRSVVTAVYNRRDTIADALDSLVSQENVDVELVVVDGGSDDGTADVVADYGDRVSVSIREPDEGIYDALNKGVAAATGEVVGFLHADDWLADSGTMARVAQAMADPDVDGVHGDLQYVDALRPDRVTRNWVAGRYDVAKFRRGWMPPHPTDYLRRCSC